MIDTALVDILQGAGPAGAVAVAALYLYRQAVRQNRDDRKYHQDLSNRLIEREQDTREKHTEVLTELITWLKRSNGH